MNESNTKLTTTEAPQPASDPDIAIVFQGDAVTIFDAEDPLTWITSDTTAEDYLNK